VALVDDDDSVEQLAAQGLDHSFADRVCSRRSRWSSQDSDAVRGEDRVECPGEPGVSVPEQERQGCHTIGEVHQKVASSLGGPRPGRMCRHPSQMCRREPCSTTISA
jgi:hypothetical protein